jgi:hypothetical protein
MKKIIIGSEWMGLGILRDNGLSTTNYQLLTNLSFDFWSRSRLQ